MNDNTPFLSKIWWLWLPLLVVPVQFALEFSFDAAMLARLHSEWGPHETLQTVTLLVALVFAARAALRLRGQGRLWLAAWMGFAALCIVYVGGEEISWGQHLFGWATPENWAAVNDQQETNLHNTSSWLDQKPRLLLELGVIVGGLVIPLLGRFVPRALPVRFAALYPPPYVAVTAGVFLACKLAHAVSEAAGFVLFERVSEVLELYLYWFVLLYVLHMLRCARAASPV
jgi:hypothetical protein